MMRHHNFSSFHSNQCCSVTIVAPNTQQSYVRVYPYLKTSLLCCDHYSTNQFTPVQDTLAFLNSEYCMTPDSKAEQCANTGQLWNAGGGIRAANRPATTGSRAFSTIPISTRLFHHVNNNISFFGQPNKFQGSEQSSHFDACYPVVLWYMSYTNKCL